MEAYEEMIQETATKEAPWYVVPTDNKWFTRVVVAAAVMETLADLDLEYPEVGEEKTQGARRSEKEVVEQVTSGRGAMVLALLAGWSLFPI
jgi:hypothetical protein